MYLYKKKKYNVLSKYILIFFLDTRRYLSNYRSSITILINRPVTSFFLVGMLENQVENYRMGSARSVKPGTVTIPIKVRLADTGTERELRRI